MFALSSSYASDACPFQLCTGVQGTGILVGKRNAALHHRNQRAAGNCDQCCLTDGCNDKLCFGKFRI